MLKQNLMLLTLGLTMLASTATAAKPVPANEWIPQEAVVAIEIHQPEAFLDPLLSEQVRRAITALPAYRKQADTQKFRELEAVIAHVEMRLGADWKSALHTLLGGGVAFAAGPTGETLLCIDARDDKMLAELHDIFHGFAVDEASKKNQPDRVSSKEYRGVTQWTFNTNDFRAVVGPRLLMANRSYVLNYALDLHADGADRSLARSSLYQAARKAVGDQAVASIFVNMQVVRLNPKVQTALSRNKNPLDALLRADTKTALEKANWLAVGAYVRDGKLVFRAVTDQTLQSSAVANFANPQGPDQGVLPNLNVPGRIAGLSLYRDLHGFYAAKDELFPERTSGLIFFENMMGIFFSGMDLTEEVFGETQPEIRLVVAEQKYDPAIGTPTVQAPAFAAVFRLRDPQKFGPVMEEAWQKAIGLVNFTRGQKALPGLVIDRMAHGEAKLTLASFRPPRQTENVEVHSRYNFRPALARIGDCLILSSTDGLAKNLITALQEQAGSAPPLAETASLIELDGPQLLSILRANREHLIRKNMVDKGHTRQKAEGEMDGLFTILEFLDHARFKVGETAGARPEAVLELKFKVPAGAPSKEPEAKPTARLAPTPLPR